MKVTIELEDIGAIVFLLILIFLAFFFATLGIASALRLFRIV